MFSRFLLFFGAAGAGLCAAEAGRRRALRGGGLCAAATGRRGFGARFPAKPCSFVNGHHVFGTKGARPARTWCTIPRKTLFLRFLCTKSGSLFGDRPAQTWCTYSRKTLFLRFLCTKFGRLFGERSAWIWCTILRKTLFLRFLCTKSGSLFGDRPARTWCTIPRKPLLFRRRAPRLWGQRRRRRTGRGASLPAKPCSFVNGHHVFGTKGARPARTWCTIPRKTLFFRQRAPRLWGQRRRRHQIPSL